MIKLDTKPKYGFSYEQLANFGFSFTLVDNKNQILFTPFMCKDYLQDIFWSQYTNRDGSIYGIRCTKEMIDVNNPRFKLAIFGGRDVNLRKHVPHLKQFLNAFERILKIDKSKVIETEDDDKIIIDFDKAWTENGTLLSTFTTLIRIAGAYTGGKIEDYLKHLYENRGIPNRSKLKPSYIRVDVERLSSLYPKLLKILEGKKPIDSWDSIHDIWNAHERGLLHYNGKFV